MLAVDPPKAISVTLFDGTWPGWLSAWRHTDTGWRAFVQYRRGPGVTHMHRVEAATLTPAP